MRIDAALALVVDSSGSMFSCVNDVTGGVKQFIGDQKKESGNAVLTAVKFDHTYTVIHDFTPINDVDEDKFAREYTPRGSTALLDAIGRTTIDMSQKLEALSAEDRPKRVVVAVITDGYENASKEFTIEKIRELIKTKEAEGWEYLFLGASLDAIDVAKNMGFSADKSASYDTSNTKYCFQNFSQKCTQARADQEVKFTDEERAQFVQSN
jgi:Mg-chelatase subunit ChlD